MRATTSIVAAMILLCGLRVAAAADLPLVDAVKDGNREAVRALLKRATDVNAREEDGTTALHWAVRGDDAETVALLIRSGANVQAANRYGITPLWLAATNGSPIVVDALLKAGADAGIALPEGETLLMTAARTGNAAVVKAFLARGREVDAREHVFGQTALMWAAAENHADATRALIDAGADVNLTSDVVEPIRWSLSNSYKGGFTALMFAARQGALDSARVLIEAGADLNATDPDGITPLLLAAINGHYDMAALLVHSGADVNRTDGAGVSPLYQTIDMHTLEFAANRPPPRLQGTLDPVGLVKILLEHGANPNARLNRARPPRKGDQIFGDPFTSEGTTPFFLAAKRADLPIMRLLLDHGADPSLGPPRQRANAFMVAAGIGWREGVSKTPEKDALTAVEMLWKIGGVDINATTVSGQTALHGAAGRGATSIIQFLVEHGARLDTKDVNGRTPLDEAGFVTGNGAHPERPDARALLRRLAGATTDAPGPR
jgi:ankyrin repeat protein